MDQIVVGVIFSSCQSYAKSPERSNAGLGMFGQVAHFKSEDAAAYEYNNRNVNCNPIHKVDLGCATL